MNDTDRSHFEILLLGQKKSLLSRLKHQREERDGGDDEVLDPLTESEEKLLGKIDLALSKIANGSYGICIDCGKAIPRERLEAKPSVSLCLACQSQHEAS